MRASGSVAVAANATSDNVLQGKNAQFPPRPSAVRFAATSSATGINATALVAGETIVDDALISHQNRVPIFPDDVLAEYGADKGDPLTFRFRNTTAGALTVFWTVDVEPIA